VDLAHDAGLREREQVVVALEVARMVLEARAAIAGFVELVALDHRAHRAVEHEDALPDELVQLLRDVGRGERVGHRASLMDIRLCG
jgi:hypothetical protein